MVSMSHIASTFSTALVNSNDTSADMNKILAFLPYGYQASTLPECFLNNLAMEAMGLVPVKFLYITQVPLMDILFNILNTFLCQCKIS